MKARRSPPPHIDTKHYLSGDILVTESCVPRPLDHWYFISGVHTGNFEMKWRLHVTDYTLHTPLIVSTLLHCQAHSAGSTLQAPSVAVTLYIMQPPLFETPLKLKVKHKNIYAAVNFIFTNIEKQGIVFPEKDKKPLTENFAHIYTINTYHYTGHVTHVLYFFWPTAIFVCL